MINEQDTARLEALLRDARATLQRMIDRPMQARVSDHEHAAQRLSEALSIIEKGSVRSPTIKPE